MNVSDIDPHNCDINIPLLSCCIIIHYIQPGGKKPQKTNTYVGKKNPNKPKTFYTPITISILKVLAPNKCFNFTEARYNMQRG